MRGNEHDAAFGDAGDIRQRTLRDEKAVDAFVDMQRRRAEDVRQMALRIEIDARRPIAALCDCRQQIEGRGGFADAALLIENCNDRHRPRFYRERIFRLPRLAQRVALYPGRSGFFKIGP